MIQDIAPSTFDNQYRNTTISENDFVVFLRGKEVLISKEEKQLPVFSQLKEKYQKENFQYAFSIDENRYFLYLPREVQETGVEIENFYYEKLLEFRSMETKLLCFILMNAYHLHAWYQDNRFCGRCGKETVHDDKQRMLFCPSCHNMIFPKIAPAVIVAVIDGDRILMSKYAGREYKKYALLAGFVEFGETAEETVQREVEEEVGLKVKNIKYYKSQPWGVDSNLLSGYFVTLDGSNQIKLDEQELALAEWFTRENMPAHDDGISLTREMMGFFEDKAAFEKWYYTDK